VCTYLVDQDRQNSLLALHVRLMRIDCVPTLVSLTLADSHVGLKQKIGMAGVSVGWFRPRFHGSISISPRFTKESSK
jgi:hypothetical protein